MQQRRSEGQEVMLSMMGVLGALCCQPLFQEEQCQAAALLALTKHLQVARGTPATGAASRCRPLRASRHL